MKVVNLASGSTGNSTYVETNHYKILIDAGKNKKYLVNSLASIGIDYKDIDYIFITHSHDDHISALKNFLKGHKAKAVMTTKIFNEISGASELENVILYEDEIQIENLDVKSYQMSHDVADIRSFVFTEDDHSFVYITDTGYIPTKYLKLFQNKEAYFIESNHDIELLTHGPYPDWLQKRVLSDEGHLSNKFSGIYLSKMIGDKTNNIMLLHLSEKNNNEDVALSTIKEYIDIKNINLSCARPNEISREVIV